MTVRVMFNMFRSYAAILFNQFRLTWHRLHDGHFAWSEVQSRHRESMVHRGPEWLLGRSGGDRFGAALQPNSDGLQPERNGLQPKSDGLQSPIPITFILVWAEVSSVLWNKERSGLKYLCKSFVPGPRSKAFHLLAT